MFVSYGSRENGAAGKANVEALKQAGIKSVFYESPHDRSRVAVLAARLVSIRAAAVPEVIKTARS